MVADEPVRPSEIARPRDVNDGAVDDAEDALSVEGELRPELSYTDAPPVDSQRAWDRLNEWLPKMLEDLRASKPFNNASKPPSAGRGIYLFSEGAQHLYVGRTGITARSRGAGKEPSTSFFNRWDQHTSRNSPPNSAPFANKLARDLAQAFDLEGPAELKKRFDLMRTADWWRLRKAEEPPDYYLAFQDDGTFQAVYAFPQGGGMSIGENESHEELMEELMAYPLSPFVEYDVQPLVDVDAAFDRFIPFIEKMSAQLAGQAS